MEKALAETLKNQYKNISLNNNNKNSTQLAGVADYTEWISSGG